ncbi:MAG TPA: EVE domain-containing protein [Elusimicrobiota bacterium]|jgi:predicted RNA-binding protein with PUA-like domain|nr:EVE domain-containing protein [Elusimicrobiota bacterium]HMX95062.1 EVE domain-containing protein [Elusimicrobiota bacterium]HNA61274.1 EVE domain-containing protein [Elusimicrobiota bacterium]HNC75349.1 EVE domain-containing protein [Elusimicrobiota bacterium]HNG44525.1 EVE domain-containing protein [Elusimicrobiota bacterium]
MEWIFSTEPKEYPWSKVQEGAARWDGIRGPAARKYMREIQAGDRIWGYHASPQKALVCWAVAAAPAYPDPAAPDWLAIDLCFDRWLPRPIALAELRADARLADMPFLRIPRLSVAPVTSDQSKRLFSLCRNPEDSRARDR